MNATEVHPMPSEPVRARPSLQLSAPQRQSVAQLVLDQLLEQIVGGGMRPGDRLPSEFELMRMLEVGRSSVREALRGLITLGLVETRPGRGAVVAEQASAPFRGLVSGSALVGRLTTFALLDLLEVREAVESQAARLAAARASDGDRKAIRAAANAVERDVDRKRTYFKSNYAFHTAVARAAHNPVLLDSVRSLAGQVRDLRTRLMQEIPEMPDQDTADHRRITEAIEAGHPQAAHEAMVRHIHHFAEVVRAGRPDS
jgi:GntR family transcriptional regulator, transcriptional repressor for pyruvate dehydrogenase complex